MGKKCDIKDSMAICPCGLRLKVPHGMGRRNGAKTFPYEGGRKRHADGLRFFWDVIHQQGMAIHVNSDKGFLNFCSYYLS